MKPLKLITLSDIDNEILDRNKKIKKYYIYLIQNIHNVVYNNTWISKTYKVDIELLKSIGKKYQLLHAQNGEKCHMAILTWSLVNEIREKYYIYGMNGENLGKEYGVTSNNIRDLLRNKTWKDVNFKYDVKEYERRKKENMDGRFLLNIELAIKIRSEYKSGLCSKYFLAEKYKVNPATIRDILYNITWKDNDSAISKNELDSLKIKYLVKKKNDG